MKGMLMDPTYPLALPTPTVLETNGGTVLGVLAVIGAAVWIVGLLCLVFADAIHAWRHSHGDDRKSDQPPSPR